MSNHPPRRVARPLLALALACGTWGCASTVNTLPPLATAEEPVREYTLELPAELEIRSAEYDAVLYSDVSGGAGSIPTTTSLGWRAFLKVHAVHRRTGEQYLLLYENIAERARPIQIIRFRSASGAGAP